MRQWSGFKAGTWQQAIDVRDFIQSNYTPYEGGAGFLAGVGDKTGRLWDKCRALLKQEREAGGVLDIDTGRVMDILSHEPGYIDPKLETIVGLQTDAPLKRGVVVNGGIRMAEQACAAYGRRLDPAIGEIYHRHATTHNTAVFKAYTDKMKQARRVGIISGLPDAYGRGRLIGEDRKSVV